MLKVYGITFDHTTNYGSCLQAYALQQAIEKITVEGEKCSYFLIPIKTFKDYPDSFDNILRRIIRKNLATLHRRSFVPFEKKYMKYVSCCRMSDLSLLNNQADAFVCGSDVIWNPDFNFGLGAFYLDFAKKYKFSYAASFGKAEIDKETLSLTKEMLNSFDSISVREKTSFEIACKCTNKDVVLVSDPVLLLESNEWNNVIIPNVVSKKFIFVYVTHLNKVFQDFINALKKQTGLEVILVTWRLKHALKQGKISFQSPEEWLCLLKNAEYVVTNSFHATVFSSMFHKKFFTVVSGEKNKGINMRMNDFLNTIGLGNRIFSSVPDVLDTSEIYYKAADEKIAGMREKSLAYLQRNLEEAYRRKMQQA